MRPSYYPSRSLLHVSKLEDFKAYLTSIGRGYRAGNGVYEVLQIQYGSGYAKIYQRDRMPEHYTVEGRLVPLVLDYLAQRKREDKETATYVANMERAYPHIKGEAE